MGEREITARSDVYALGAITYEMLIGEPPFTGPTAQAIVAKVMTAEPAGLTAQRKSVPPAVEDAVLTALAKLPADRFGSAAEFAAAVGGRADGRTGGRAHATRSVRPSAVPPVRLTAAIAAIATAAAVLLATRGARRPPEQPVTRLTLDVPDLRVNHTGFYGTALAIARDGSRFAFVARPGSNVTQLLVRERGELEPRTLAGTEGADAPFFSPDGQWIGYVVANKLFKIPAAGGTPVQLAGDGSLAVGGGTWLDDGRIVYLATGFAFKSVASQGGATTVVVPAPSTGVTHYPAPLPRKDVLLATRCGNTCAGPVLVAIDLKSQTMDTILIGAARGFYLPSGILLAVRGTAAWWAVPSTPRPCASPASRRCC